MPPLKTPRDKKKSTREETATLINPYPTDTSDTRLCSNSYMSTVGEEGSQASSSYQSPVINNDGILEIPQLSLQRSLKESNVFKFDQIPARIPKSGFKLFGRAWYLGAEDMLVPAGCAAVFDFIVVALAIASLVLFIENSSINNSCVGTDKTYFTLLLILETVGWGLSLVIDLSIVISALKSRIFEPNLLMVKLTYARFFYCVLLFPLVIFCTYAFAKLDNSCQSNTSGILRKETKLIMTMIVCQWVNQVASNLFNFCSFCLASGRGKNTGYDTYISRMSLFHCCYGDENTSTVYESLAATFEELFKNDSGAHIVPSDIAVGLLLVQAAQRNNIAAGHQYLIADHEDRANRTLVSPTTKVATERLRSGPNEISTMGNVQMSSLQNTEQQEDENIKNQPKYHNGEDVPLMQDMEHYSHRSGRTTDVLTSLGHAQWMVNDVLHFKQPAQLNEEIALLRDAKHYAAFAQGVYGWALYIWDNCAAGLLCCDAIACGIGRPDTCGWGHRYESGVITGAGCCDGYVCNSDTKAFLKHTGLLPSNVLRYRGSAKYGKCVYIVSLDPSTQSIVVTVRGTMSIADTMTDLDADPFPIPGIPNSYSHRGMLRSLSWILEDLGFDKYGTPLDSVDWSLTKLLEKHNSKLVITGHSLGGGIATLLAVVLTKHIPTLQCFAFAPPQVLDPVSAEKARHNVVSFVYRHDMISRLSQASIFKLRLQMVNAFKFCVDSKFDILNLSRRQRYKDIFENQPPHWDLAEGFVHSPGSLVELVHMSQESAVHDERKRRRTGSVSTEDALHSEPVGASHSEPSADVVESAASHIIQSKAKSNVKLVEMRIGGKIFHLMPAEPKAKALCCGTKKTKELIVYPADARAFDELYVSATMFTDHMPIRYCLKNLDLDRIKVASSPENVV